MLELELCLIDIKRRDGRRCLVGGDKKRREEEIHYQHLCSRFMSPNFDISNIFSNFFFFFFFSL